MNISSISAGGSLDFDNLNQEKGFSSHECGCLCHYAHHTSLHKMQSNMSIL